MLNRGTLSESPEGCNVKSKTTHASPESEAGPPQPDLRPLAITPCRNDSGKRPQARVGSEGDESEPEESSPVNEHRCNWIIDSGASVHTCNDRTAFTSFTDTLAAGRMLYGIGGAVPIAGVGTVELKCTLLDMSEDILVLKRVRYTPDTHGENHISVSRILEDGGQVIFRGIRQPLAEMRINGRIYTAHEHEGLYFLNMPPHVEAGQEASWLEKPPSNQSSRVYHFVIRSLVPDLLILLQAIDGPATEERAWMRMLLQSGPKGLKFWERLHSEMATFATDWDEIEDLYDELGIPGDADSDESDRWYEHMLEQFYGVVDHASSNGGAWVEKIFGNQEAEAVGEDLIWVETFFGTEESDESDDEETDEDEDMEDQGDEAEEEDEVFSDADAMEE